MLNFIKKYRYYIIVLVLIIIACVALTPKTFQNDTYYLIKIGDDILKHGIDFKDHYAWSENLAYNYPHFLYNIFLALIYNSFGFTGVYISTIILFIILAISIFYILTKNVSNKTLRTISLALIICAIYPFITARSQTITYILFIWQIHFIRQLLATGKKKYSFLLILFSWITAMAHAIPWPFVFILYLPFVCEQVIAKFIKPNQKIKGLIAKFTIQKSPYFKTLLITLAASALIGLLTPSRICYTAMLKTMLGETQNYIEEHEFLKLLSAGDIYIFILGITLLIFTLSKTRVKLSNFFLFAGITFMSFYAVRNLSLFYIICIPLTAMCAEQALCELDPKFLEAFNFSKKIKILLKICTFIAVAIIISSSAIKNLKTNFHSNENTCQGVVNYIKNNTDMNNIKIYNHYSLGAYLLFNDIPVFIDSRAEIYTPQFGSEKNVFNDYLEISRGNYEEFVEQYKITHFLTYKNESLSKILAKDQSYNELYSDDQFVLYERNI